MQLNRLKVLIVLVFGLQLGCFQWSAPDRMYRFVGIEEALVSPGEVRYLSLHGQDVKKVPDCLDAFPLLERLEFRGTLLADLDGIGRASALKWLDIEESGLIILSPEVYSINSLLFLHLNDNKLEALPDGIGALTNLRYLNLDRNKLLSLPSDISKLADLRWLRLNGNHLKVLQQEIGALRNLERLYLAKNALGDLPPDIVSLEKLTDLVLSHNRLNAFPDCLLEMPNLKRLDLDHTGLSSLPVDISGLKNLQWLRLDGNNFSAEERARIRSSLPDVRVVF